MYYVYVIRVFLSTFVDESVDEICKSRFEKRYSIVIALFSCLPFRPWSFLPFLSSFIFSLCSSFSIFSFFLVFVSILLRPANLSEHAHPRFISMWKIRVDMYARVSNGPLSASLSRVRGREKAQLYGQECLIDVTTFEVGGSSGRHFFISFINELSLLLFVSRFDCWLLVTPLPFPGYIFSRWFRDSLRNFCKDQSCREILENLFTWCVLIN